MAVFYAALGDDAETLARKGGELLRLARPRDHRRHHASIATTPDAVRTYLAAFEAAGADDVLIVPCSSDPAQLDLIADAALRVPALV